MKNIIDQFVSKIVLPGLQESPRQAKNAPYKNCVRIAVGFLLGAGQPGCGTDSVQKEESSDVDYGTGPDSRDATNSENPIMCKANDPYYCQTKAGLAGKSEVCVTATCVPLNNDDPQGAGVCQFEDIICKKSLNNKSFLMLFQA